MHHWFSFEREGEERGAVIVVSRQVAALLPRVEVDPAKAAILVGLPVLEAQFRSGAPAEDENGRVRFPITTDMQEQLEAVVRHKSCRWQRRTPPGLVCDATPLGEDARTTKPACAACTIPDDRVICRHLVHPDVRGWQGMGTGLGRDVHGVFCEAGQDIGAGAECVPGGKPCWERVVADPTPAVGEPPPDVAERSADEVDYFRLVYRDRYGASVLTVPQARSISQFFGTCDSEADFTRRVTALADLLAHLQPYEQLSPEEQTDDQGHRVGSLVALRRVMGRDYPAAVPHVEALRRIPNARRVFPIHSRTEDVVAAMRGLGVDYPTTDWHGAWLSVLGVFLASLGGVRAAIQSGEPVDFDSD
jgi:hypothetical protein